MIYSRIEGLIHPTRDVEISQPPENTRKFFLHFLTEYKWIVLLALITSGISALSEIYLYAYVGELIDWMNDSTADTFFEKHGNGLMLMAIVAGVIRPISSFLSRAIINLCLSPGITNTVRWRNYRYVLRQSLGFFQDDFAGRIAQKVMQTGHALREAVINVIDGVWLLLIYLAGIVFLFIGMHQLLLMPIFIWLACYAIVISKMVPPVRQRSARLSEANSGLVGKVVDSYTNIQSVKLFAHADREEAFVAEGFKTHLTAFRSLMRSIVSMTGTLIILNTLLILFTAWISIRLWQDGTITVGEVAIVNGLVIRLNQMSGWILRTITSLFENIGAVQNGIETISKSNAIVDNPNAKPISVSKGIIEFKDVQFEYNLHHPIIKNFSLKIKAGEKIGLVGRSGAGKTTLVNLLLRFYELDSGKIFIDSQDITQVEQESLREKIAMVTQDTSLLHRSIHENIGYGKPSPSDGEIHTAARLSKSDEFINLLIDPSGRTGYEAQVGERGVKLSGGQRQRIAIARVILKNAPILILDEATSALDSEVEAAIQDQFKLLMENKTVIAIAHRLSTIASLDRLIVMDKGEIVEQGTHLELIAKNGLYANLWHRQSGGFLGN